MKDHLEYRISNSNAFLNIGNFYFKRYGANINYKEAIRNYELLSYLNNSKAHFKFGVYYSEMMI